MTMHESGGLQGSDLILERLMALHPKVIDLVLDRVWRLLAALDHPERKLPPVIHLAGTNGKGSTQAMIRAGLEAAANRVHAYTSPHLARFHERIRLAGALIPEAELTAVLEECEAANGPEPITYFEITTCAALLAMARVPAEYTLLETGMGGRLDATNVVAAPRMTVITPISMDHEAFLGDTVAKIAGEKAGILKRGVPCVVGPQVEAALDVIEARASAVGAPLLVYGQHWHVWEERDRLIYQDDHGLLDLPRPVLPGAHQVQNAGAALAVLRHMQMGDAAYEGAVTQAVWPARMQRLVDGPLVSAAGGAQVWLDGGHNPAAGIAVAEVLSRAPHPTHAICGMMNTKDARGFLRPMVPQLESLTAVTIPGEANSLPAEDLAAQAAEVGHTARQAPSVATALARILDDAPEARVLICGSLYLAGHVLRENS